MIRTPADMMTEVRENMRSGAGQVTIQHFFKADEIRARTRLCARLTLPPGASIGTHPHEREDEVFVVVKGAGVLDDGQTETPVAEGDAILTGNGESHGIRNTGDEDLEIIAVIMLYQ